MPRFLFDLDARAVGRSPLHRTRELDADDALDAITRAATAIPAGDWGDAEITSLSVSIVLLTGDQRPA